MRREKTATSTLDGALEIWPLGAEAIKRWHLRSCHRHPTLPASLSSKSMSGRKWRIRHSEDMFSFIPLGA